MLVHFGVNVALKKHAAYMFMKIHLKPTRRTAWWLWNSMQASLGWLLDLDLNSHRLMSSGVKIPWALTWKVVTLRCLRPQATELPELCCLWTNTSQRGVKQIQATGHAFVAELLRRNCLDWSSCSVWLLPGRVGGEKGLLQLQTPPATAVQCFLTFSTWCNPWPLQSVPCGTRSGQWFNLFNGLFLFQRGQDNNSHLHKRT